MIEFQTSLRRFQWVFCLGAAVFSTSVCWSAPSPDLNVPKAENAAAPMRRLREMTPGQADKQTHVVLRGIITFADTKADLGMFLQDETGGIYVKLDEGIDVRAGQEIEVNGVTGAGDFVPLVKAQSWRVLGDRTLPPPRPVSYAQLATGQEDSQWVEVRGVVRSILPAEKEHTRVDLLVNGQRLSALFTDFAVTNSDALIGATVRIQGVCRTRFNKMRQLRGPWLSATSAADLTVENSASASLTEIPLSGLLQFNSPGYYGHRVKVRGIVTEQKGDSVFLQDKGARATIRTQQTARFAPGDYVEAIGFPVLGPHAPVLEDAILRALGRRTPPVPVDVTLDQLPSEDYEAALVHLRARLINHIQRFDQHVLVLDASNLLVSAVLDEADVDKRFGELQDGSELDLTGVCVAQPLENWNASLPPPPESFQLLLRSSSDVTVLRNPPFWTLGRLLWIVSAMGIVLLAGLAWVVVLDRRVRRQTAIIQEKIQREAVSEERTRIAREFHDTLEQELAAITIQLDAVAAQFHQAPEQARRLLNLARTMSRRSLAEARRSVWDLRSHLLERSNLVDALSEVAKPLAAGHRVEIIVHATGDRRKLPGQVENHLLRVAQEAIANALKHSSATKIVVQIDYQPQALRLSVRDNGTGFDLGQPDPMTGGHFGLQDMRERAQKIGACLCIKSNASQGTEILVELTDNTTSSGARGDFRVSERNAARDRKTG